MSSGEQLGPSQSDLNFQQGDSPSLVEVPKGEPVSKRDEVLGKIENILKVEDEEVWKKGKDALINGRLSELLEESQPTRISLIDKKSASRFY